MIGRPYIYGLAVAGPKGVKAILDILANEIRQTLILMGIGGVLELDRGMVTRRDQAR